MFSSVSVSLAANMVAEMEMGHTQLNVCMMVAAEHFVSDWSLSVWTFYILYLLVLFLLSLTLLAASHHC